MPYLRDYFNNFKTNELNYVRIVISDMDDGYATIARHYFQKAIHIVDMFHVIRLLTTAINTLRVRTMNLYADKGSVDYNFMKKIENYFFVAIETFPIFFILTNLLVRYFTTIF